MNNKYIVALDQGTTSSRAIIFNHRGDTLSSSQKELKQFYPSDGWVEHDPNEIWLSQSQVLEKAVYEAGISSDNIEAIGVTNQRETTIVWDKNTGEPVYNAIVWQDRRTANYCKEGIENGLEAMISLKTGLRLDPYFSGTKLRWILENVEGVRLRAEQGQLLFGTVDSWLIWKLTGGAVHVTDVTNASRTMLFNIHTEEWDEEILELLNIPRIMLPEVKSCSEVYGHTCESVFPGNIPIAGAAGDQHAALFGQCCFNEGQAKNTYGTGCFLLKNTGSRAIKSQNNLLTTIAWKVNGKTEYALEGSVFIGGSVIQWLRDELELIQSAEDCNTFASSVSDNGGVYLVPAFTGLGAPHWDPYARGAVFGLTRAASKGHVCRAALESIAFQVADLLHCMRADSGIALTSLSVDGGASASELLMEFQADLLQVPVVRPKITETTALGAAFFAGLAVGYWADKEELAQCWIVDKTYHPSITSEKAEGVRVIWEKAVKRSKAWAEMDESV